MGILFLVFKTPPVRRDSLGYHNDGIEVAKNGIEVLTSYSYGPTYPAFLGICFKIFGGNDNAVRLVQVLLSGFVSLLVYSLASRYYGENIGFVSALLYSFCPTFAHYPGFFLRETLLVFLFVLSNWLIMKSIDTKSLFYGVLAGTALTLTALTKPAFLFFGLFVVSVLVVFCREHINWNRRSAGVAAMIALLPVICFSGFSYLIPKEKVNVMEGSKLGLILLLNGSELALSDKEKAASLIGLISRNLAEKIFPDINFRTLWPYPAIFQSLEESADRKYNQTRNKNIQMALELYKEHPFGYFVNRITTLMRLNAFQYPSRLNETHRWKDFYNRGNNKSLISIVLDIFLKFLSNPFFWALGGVVVMKRKNLPILPVLLPVLYVNLVHCFIDGIPRYGLPALTFYFIAGAILFSGIFRGIVKKVSILKA